MHRVIIVTELVAYPTGFLKRDPDIKIAPVLSEDINCLRRTSHLFLCQIVARRCTLISSHNGSVSHFI
jgi:hypothetical protein